MKGNKINAVTNNKYRLLGIHPSMTLHGCSYLEVQGCIDLIHVFLDLASEYVGYQVGGCGAVKVGPQRRAKLCINVLETGTIVGRPTLQTKHI